MIRLVKSNKNYVRSEITVDFFWITASKLGNMRQIRNGAKAGKLMFKGAFIATMPNGHKGIFRRKRSTSLPINEFVLHPHAWKIIRN
jgi:hypothetical protein